MEERLGQMGKDVDIETKEKSYIERNITAYRTRLGTTEQERYARFIKLIQNVNQETLQSILAARQIKLPANDREVIEFLQGLNEEDA